MKIFDRVEVTETDPELNIEQGMTGTIVDFNIDDNGAEATVELDDECLADPEEDDPIRNVGLGQVRVVEPASSASAG
ncbi:MAG: hypothetical protein JST12_14670 [Armatimonadetes bacterium]|nr:hypothetical protein [Armatimonadota bacterium]